MLYTPFIFIIAAILQVRMVKKLAEGGFAFVYLVEDVRTGEQYALKRCVAAERHQEELILGEIEIMRRLTATNNPNIVGFLGHIVKQVQGAKEYYILLEFCSGGSLIGKLQAIMDSGKRTDERFMVQVFEGALHGLAELHKMSPPVAHRDIKIENILLDNRGIAKLCDFGSCSTKSGVLTTSSEMLAEQDRIAKHSTEMYRAPELCDLYRAKRLGWALGPKVDVWAMGGVLYTLATFKHPFEEGGVLGILSGKVDMPPFRGYSKYVGYIISKCFTMDPAQRPSVEDLLQLCQAWRSFLKEGKHADAALGEQVDSLIPGVISGAANTAAPAPAAARPAPSVPTRQPAAAPAAHRPAPAVPSAAASASDRKSTRLNSSH